ncbi:fimbrial protein [Serratia marcescens]|uniref:fimbrial protein n=1 Tax=Serratia marcescens TaxID=615 RepID=UPI0039890F20
MGMQRKDTPYVGRWLDETKYYCTLGALALMVPATLGAMLWLLPAADAQSNNWDIDGANGTLYVYGALTESACRIDMTSARQEVNLGEIGTGRLQTVGAQGQPVRFEVRLEDCLRSPVVLRDVRTNGITWSRDQPGVKVSFRAVRDADNPQLVKAEGVTGLGLRLTDSYGHDVRLGSDGGPVLLMPGQNSLSYTVTPERTPASLKAGSYQSVVDFHLSYD